MIKQTHTTQVHREINSHGINRVNACLYKPILHLPQSRKKDTQLLSWNRKHSKFTALTNYRAKLTELPTCSRQLHCNTTPVCKLHQQTVSSLGAAAVQSLEPQWMVLLTTGVQFRAALQHFLAALPEAPEMICLWRKEGISSSQIEGKHFQALRAARLA